MHIRAVARDGNNVTGPGVGASETRTIRIARADEYDSTAVEAAAPSDEDKSVISERMLIMLAEALVQKHDRRCRGRSSSPSRRPSATTRPGCVAPSATWYLRDSAASRPAKSRAARRARAREDRCRTCSRAPTRRRTRSIDPLDFDGGESPVVAVNKPLLDAYNAMWDASTQLETGEPDRALPPMRRALAAIQLARRAERVYLRGAPPPVVIDVAKVRLAGKMADAASSARPVAAGDSVARRLDERFLRIVDLAARDAPTATDSLLVLRIDALSDNAPFAAALDAGNSRYASRRRRRCDRGPRHGAPHARRYADRARFSRAMERHSVMSDFVFATAQYESGDWDSAPLLPSNIIDTIARYTDIPVAPTGVVVPLGD